MYQRWILCLALGLVYAAPAYAAPGTVSGTVTRAATSTPVAGSYLNLCTASYTCEGAPTDASGVFTFTVEPGTYYLYTYNQQGLVNEIYDNIGCLGICDLNEVINTGTPVVVTSGGALAGLNFALDEGGRISGTVMNAATSAPMQGLWVTAYAVVGEQIVTTGYGDTDAAGVYTVSGLAAGVHHVYIGYAAGFINEIYDNIPCINFCSYERLFGGTPIAVTSGVTTPNTNFALDPEGSITGVVRDAATSAPLENVYVSITLLDSSGEPTAQAGVSTDAAGKYTITGLPTGSYYMSTGNNLGYFDEWFDNIACDGTYCGDVPATATAVSVTAGSVTSGKNFDLERGGTITGSISNAATSAPLDGVTVYVHKRSSTGSAEYVSQATSDTSGIYSVGGLRTGTYYLSTYNDDGFLDEIFEGIHCGSNCWSEPAVESGTGIAVTTGLTTSGKNFVLEMGGAVSGRVLSSAGSTPIADAWVYLYGDDAEGNYLFGGQGLTNASGEYIVRGLLGGTYYAISDAPRYIDEIYGGVICLGSCYASTAKSVGTPIVVALGATASGRDFDLDAGGSISGTVRNAATSAPLNNVQIYVYRHVGDGYSNYITSDYTNSSGTYTIGGLPAGDYFLATDSNEPEFQNQIFTGINCPHNCDSEIADAHGTPVTVIAGATASGRDFALRPVSGRVAGIITNAATKAPADDVYVYLYGVYGTEYSYVAYGHSDASGAYEIDNVPPGTYFAVSNSYGQYLDEIHDNFLCLTTCDYGVAAVLVGAPITVTTGTVSVNFALQPLPFALPPGQPYSLRSRIAGGTVTLSWHEPYEFGEAVDYLLEVGLSPGSTALSIPVDTTTFTATGVPPGHYYVRVRGRNAAGVGPASSDYELTVNAGGSGAPDAPSGFAIFTVGTKLHAVWAPSEYGGATTDYLVEVGTATGLANIGTYPIARSIFELEPLPPAGVYFLRVRGRNALSIGKPSNEVMLVIGGVPAPPDPPGNIGVGFDASRRGIIGWTPPRGEVTGYFLEVGSASGRSDVAVFTLPATPPYYWRTNVGPGVYYLRLRAFNTHGVGLASYETTLIVP
jgi:5-hydroxyisourate hydrolase-like protein (transthyretin family)